MAGETKHAQRVDRRLPTPLPARWQIKQKHETSPEHRGRPYLPKSTHLRSDGNAVDGGLAMMVGSHAEFRLSEYRKLRRCAILVGQAPCGDRFGAGAAWIRCAMTVRGKRRRRSSCGERAGFVEWGENR